MKRSSNKSINFFRSLTKMEYDRIKGNLIEIRKERKITILEMANQIGVTESAISQFERGKIYSGIIFVGYLTILNIKFIW